jgi:hypothetical protein
MTGVLYAHPVPGPVVDQLSDDDALTLDGRDRRGGAGNPSGLQHTRVRPVPTCDALSHGQMTDK